MPMTQAQFDEANRVTRMENMVLFMGHAMDMMDDAIKADRASAMACEIEKMRNKMVRMMRTKNLEIDHANSP